MSKGIMWAGRLWLSFIVWYCMEGTEPEHYISSAHAVIILFEHDLLNFSLHILKAS
jgi:hypothetical protein